MTEPEPSGNQEQRASAKRPIPDFGRIAGIDFGTVRIGVAITDPDRILASPLENYNRRTLEKDAMFFRDLVQDERIVAFVVGLPVHLSGDSSPMSEAAIAFGQWLGIETGLPVVWFDERMTSSQAEKFLATGKLTKKKRKERLDKLAAQIMLAAFLESDQHGHSHFLPPIDDGD